MVPPAAGPTPCARPSGFKGSGAVASFLSRDRTAATPHQESSSTSSNSRLTRKLRFGVAMQASAFHPENRDKKAPACGRKPAGQTKVRFRHPLHKAELSRSDRHRRRKLPSRRRRSKRSALYRSRKTSNLPAFRTPIHKIAPRFQGLEPQVAVRFRTPPKSSVPG